MKVQDLQQFLRSLAQPLTSSGGTKVAADLERAAAGFEHFKDMSIQDFCAFLDRANHLVTTGELPTAGRSRRSTGGGDTEAVQQATQRLMEMYERGVDTPLPADEVRAEIQKLQDFRVEDLKLMARELGLNRSFRRKEDALEALERRLTEPREAGAAARQQPADTAASAADDDGAAVEQEEAGMRS